MSKVLLLILFSLSPIFAAPEIDWEKDLKSAYAQAAKEKKPLMIMVEGVHCRWCRKMIHGTFGEPGISRRLQRFVLVRLDKESEEARTKLPEVKYVPTLFFVTAKKKILLRVTGYFNVGDFNSWLDDVEKELK
jgi:thioredoxin-related protein